jgi:hypothetical protein
MKSAFHLTGLLGLVVAILLLGEISFLVRGWLNLEDLKLANQLQIRTNRRLADEIDGLKLAQPRIMALFARLNESVVVRTGTSDFNRNQANRSLTANRDNTDQEPPVISRLTEMGVVSQPSHVPNGETARIYMAGSTTLEFSRTASLIAELENSNPFLYFDKVVLNRPDAVPPFSSAPTYLDSRFILRLLSAK